MVLLIVVADVHLAAECHSNRWSACYQPVDDFQYSCFAGTVICRSLRPVLAALDV